MEKQEPFQLDIKFIMDKARQSVDTKDRIKMNMTHKSCFIGRELVKWLLINGHVKDIGEGINLCKHLLDSNRIAKVQSEESAEFNFDGQLYRFVKEDDAPQQDSKQHTEVPSWHEILNKVNMKELDSEGIQKQIGDITDFNQKSSHIPSILFDKHNCDMLDGVRPIRWVDPSVKGAYDMVVIGAGAGGLVTAASARGLGAKVAIIERGFMGGDCLITGCVPSKAFIAAANVAHSARNSYKFGINIKGDIEVDFGKVMERMRKIRADISENDSVERFNNFLGADVFLGEAKFKSENEVEINGQTLNFQRCAIASGGRPFIPNIIGIDAVPYYTSENIFNLTMQPQRLLVVGGGPIGCELSQAFQRLGTQVYQVQQSSRLLSKEDQDAAYHVQEQLEQDGVTYHFNTKIKEVKLSGSTSANGFKRVTALYEQNGQVNELEVDAVLFAMGRSPNVDGMGLEIAGIKYDKQFGITTDDYLRTSNELVYAVGDCASKYQLTHNSDIHARYVVRNALFQDKLEKSKIILPWCTFTDPEIAHVGQNEKGLKKEGVKYDTYYKFFDKLDRALCEEKNGFMKIHTKEGSDQILGATLVGGPAGDMISQITTAMFNGIGLSKMGRCVYPYPTYAESFRHLADQYNRKQIQKSTSSIIPGLNEIKLD